MRYTKRNSSPNAGTPPVSTASPSDQNVPRALAYPSVWTPPAANRRPEGGKVAYVFGLIYLAIIFSRILDVTVPHLKIPLFTLIAMCVALLLSGNAFRLLSNRAGILLCAFTAWLGITAVLGIWWTGSLGSVVSEVMALALGFVIVGTITTTERLKKALSVIAFAILGAALQSYVFGSQDTGRLELTTGSFRDPNEYAITLLMGLSLLLFFIVSVRNFAWKLIAFVGVIVILRTTLYTGSRGALIASGVLALLLFIRVPLQQKIAVIVAGAILMPAAYAIMPEYLKLRYLTLFTDDVKTTDNRLREQVMGGDLNSSETRLALLGASLRMTLHHPLFGVGPGNFPTENFAVTEREQNRKIWLVSHNSYTQVSSETGIPGFLLFISILTLALRNTWTVLRAARQPKPPPPLLVDCARYLNLTMLTICVGAFFLSIAYDSMFYVLVGLSIALEKLYAYHLATARDTVPRQGMVVSPGGIPQSPQGAPRTVPVVPGRGQALWPPASVQIRRPAR